MHYEATARHADGRTIDLAVAASVVSGTNGVPVNLSVNLLDITQRRAAERERRARLEAEVARAAAEAASRAKSEFVAALNHELRTPLQAITGFTELLRTLDLPPDRRQAALEHIGAATEHVLSMVDDLLDIAKIEADALPIRVEPVELRGLLDEVLALLAPLAAEHASSCGPPSRRAGRGPRRPAPAPPGADQPGHQRRPLQPGGRLGRGRGEEIWRVHGKRGGPGLGPRDPGGDDAPAVHPVRPARRRMLGRAGAGLGLVVARALTQAMGGTLEIRSAAGGRAPQPRSSCRRRCAAEGPSQAGCHSSDRLAPRDR